MVVEKCRKGITNMKRKLTELHTCTIDGFLAKNKPVDKIVAILVKEFNLSEKSVRVYIESKQAEVKIHIDEGPAVPVTPIPNHIINKTAGGRGGIWVMT